jgi:hypothetical protein
LSPSATQRFRHPLVGLCRDCPLPRRWLEAVKGAVYLVVNPLNKKEEWRIRVIWVSLEELQN